MRPHTETKSPTFIHKPARLLEIRVLDKLTKLTSLKALSHDLHHHAMEWNIEICCLQVKRCNAMIKVLINSTIHFISKAVHISHRIKPSHTESKFWCLLFLVFVFPFHFPATWKPHKSYPWYYVKRFSCRCQSGAWRLHWVLWWSLNTSLLSHRSNSRQHNTSLWQTTQPPIPQVFTRHFEQENTRQISSFGLCM